MNNQKTTYCIVDDEPIAHRIIEGYCAELPYLYKAGNAYNAFEASTIAMQQDIDLIFLDLNMPKMTGFEWLRTLKQPPKIIVTSAYQEYALEGYELDIVDYLLKPFSLQRFLKAVNKANESKNSESITAPSQTRSENNRFFLKGDKKHHLVHTEDILFIEAYGSYAKVVLEQETIVTHQSISSLEKQLAAPDFIRVHKSFIIATNKIKTVEGNSIAIGTHLVPVGQTYKQQLKQIFKSS